MTNRVWLRAWHTWHVIMAFVAPVGGSLRPAPLTDYWSASVLGARPGVRRFSHHEEHKSKNGQLMVRWQADVDPATIFSLDLEHQNGARLLQCEQEGLVLHVPAASATSAHLWEHVVSSDALHGCTHLGRGQHLYHRVVSVDNISASVPDRGMVTVSMATRQLDSASNIFSHLNVSFEFSPAAAKTFVPVSSRNTPRSSSEPSRNLSRAQFSRRMQAMSWQDASEETDPVNAALLARAELGADGLPEVREDKLGEAFHFRTIGRAPDYSSSVTPITHETNDMADLDTPALSDISWNWDYEKNTTRNPEIEIEFPGGEGWLRLYKPYLKAHIGFKVDYSSRLDTSTSQPQVRVRSEINGVTDMNVDAAASADFREDAVMGSPSQFNYSVIAPEISELAPLKVYIGGVPFQIDPSFNCRVSAYHAGQMKGSLRVALKTKLLISGVMNFDTDNGLQTNLSVEATDVTFTPPTWLIFTRHFELGVMLEPELWLHEGSGFAKNLRFGMGFKPYLNISIRQTGEPAVNTSAIFRPSGDGGRLVPAARAGSSLAIRIAAVSMAFVGAAPARPLNAAELRITRNGRTFTIPMVADAAVHESGNKLVLTGSAVRHMTPRLDLLSESPDKIPDSHIALLLDGVEAGRGTLPPGSFMSAALQGSDVDFAVYDPVDEAVLVATGALQATFEVGSVNASAKSDTDDVPRHLLQGSEPENLQSTHRLSWRSDVGDSSEADFAEHMNAMSDVCDEKPLLYSIGVGVYEKGDVSSVVVPQVASHDDSPENVIASEWSSGYKSVVHETMSDSLNKLLPAAFCKGGLCHGELPGCKPHPVDAMYIPKIAFKLSRKFRMNELVMPEMRRTFAYGLAILPTALEIGEEVIDVVEATVKEEIREEQELKKVAAGRVLSAAAEEHGGEETDTIVVKVKSPIGYRLDRPLLEKLIRVGAFNLLSDGREKTHGPVYITAFELQDPDKAAPHEFVDAHMDVVDWMRSLGPATLTLGVVSAVFAFVGVVGYRKSRRMQATYNPLALPTASDDGGDA